MKKALCIGGLLLASAAMPVAAEPNEATLRVAVDQALWPGDIVQAAEHYLHVYPDGPRVGEVRSLREQALRAWRIVRGNEVQLYRSSFTPREGGETLRDMHRAALGDAQAAIRLAHASRDAGDGQHTQRYVGWLQYAAQLGDKLASYELALHFRRTDQPILAARYEAVAIAQGYEPAPSLDNTRK